MKNPLKEYGLFGWNYRYLLTHPWIIIRESYDSVKYFIQRGWRGYSDRDLWSLDAYLASWMPAALAHLGRTKRGTPIGMTPKGWDTRLRIMREGFEAANALGDIPSTEESKRLKRQMDRGLKMFAECFLNLWD